MIIGAVKMKNDLIS